MKHDASERCPRCEAIISTCHLDLQNCFWLAKGQFPDLHVSCGYRGEQEQVDAYNRGSSRLHWPHSRHNKVPSMAMDLFQIRPDGVAGWPTPWFGQIHAWLKDQGHTLVWGGAWKKFSDAPHFEIPDDM